MLLLGAASSPPLLVHGTAAAVLAPAELSKRDETVPLAPAVSPALVAADPKPVLATPLSSASALLLATAPAPLLDDAASARVLSGLPADVCSSPPLDVVAGPMSALVDSGRSAPVLLRTPPPLVGCGPDAALLLPATEPSSDVVAATKDSP